MADRPSFFLHKKNGTCKITGAINFNLEKPRALPHLCHFHKYFQIFFNF